MTSPGTNSNASENFLICSATVFLVTQGTLQIASCHVQLQRTGHLDVALALVQRRDKFDFAGVVFGQAVTGFDKIPTPSISISMVSPAFIQTGGVRA